MKIALVAALSTLAQASVYIYCEPLPGGGRRVRREGETHTDSIRPPPLNSGD